MTYDEKEITADSSSLRGATGGRHIYFLGAGTSIHCGIPLTKNFIPFLLEESFTDPRLLRAREFVRDFFAGGVNLDPPVYPKFEQVLTLLDMAIEQDHYFSHTYHHKYLRQLRNDFLYLIWVLLKKASTSERFELFDAFASSLDSSNIVMSLNYDTLLDQSILNQFGGINYGLDFSTVYSDQPVQFTEPSPLLLKLHGSLNWLYCPNCESFYLYLGKSAKKIFDENPELCLYDNCYLKGIIIPPSDRKDYGLVPLSLMWIKASKYLRGADKITFIGYSLNEIDMQVLYLLKRSLFNNPHPPEIEVVDPDPSDAIFFRYRRLFGKITERRMTFEQYISSR
jgi:hypothetical protein